MLLKQTGAGVTLHDAGDRGHTYLCIVTHKLSQRSMTTATFQRRRSGLIELNLISTDPERITFLFIRKIQGSDDDLSVSANGGRNVATFV